jgi:glycosyltransferase involved in cell wall biosynthesis
MKIVHLIPSVDPAHGGPLEHARILAAEHNARGHETIFITLDDPKSVYVRDFPYQLHATGPVRGFMKSSQNFAECVAQLAPHCDIAVVHGLWNHASIGGYRALRKAGLPWVIFPHGMLDPYFRRAKPIKHVIKQVYWWLWQGRMLSSAQQVLFTCTEEQRLAQGAFWGHQGYSGKVVAFCAADQRMAADKLHAGHTALRHMLPQLADRPYFLFISRIHPKKAVDNLIRAYASVLIYRTCPDLVIAGPDTAGWQAKLEHLAQSLGVGARVHFPGMLQGEVKAAAFEGAQAFVLPSHQENFGIVVAEALSLGVPVLISDKVNIWREVISCGAGLAQPDTEAGTAQLFDQFLNLSPQQLNQMRIHARQCYEQNFSAKASAEDVLAALMGAVTASTKEKSQ